MFAMYPKGWTHGTVDKNLNFGHEVNLEVRYHEQKITEEERNLLKEGEYVEAVHLGLCNFGAGF